jgi:hypothetical protein
MPTTKSVIVRYPASFLLRRDAARRKSTEIAIKPDANFTNCGAVNVGNAGGLAVAEVLGVVDTVTVAVPWAPSGLDVALTLPGLTVQLDPEGAPLQVRATVPEKLARPEAVMPYVADWRDSR